MNNFLTIFNDIQSKFSEIFNENISKLETVTKEEKNYLNIIYKLKSTTLTKFADLAEVTKPAATQIINKFINKGYVTKTTSPEDKRFCCIELTDQIKKVFIESYKKLNQICNECLSLLTKEEFEFFNSLLLKINENL
ncbi:MAG: winged helix-turn-helix transcriptional regulator [Firmicutes bacterium]|nr:winged helix-turn-helix transcriptional regulator [Bacillota bacterium]